MRFSVRYGARFFSAALLSAVLALCGVDPFAQVLRGSLSMLWQRFHRRVLRRGRACLAPAVSVVEAHLWALYLVTFGAQAARRAAAARRRNQQSWRRQRGGW